MKNIVVIAPHPDDETLGCGGTLLKHKNNGDQIHWVIITEITEKLKVPQEKIEKREIEIKTVSDMYGFTSVHKLGLPTTELDTLPMGDIVAKVSKVFTEIKPEVIYLPYRGDVHTDHAVVYDAVIACTKWFRYPYVKKVLVYETLSETDFGINTDLNFFQPNVFVDISDFLEKKIEIMNVFESEVGEFPFPRSDTAIRSLAQVRGAASGYHAAEAYMLLRERC